MSCKENRNNFPLYHGILAMHKHVKVDKIEQAKVKIRACPANNLPFNGKQIKGR